MRGRGHTEISMLITIQHTSIRTALSTLGEIASCSAEDFCGVAVSAASELFFTLFNFNVAMCKHRYLFVR